MWVRKQSPAKMSLFDRGAKNRPPQVAEHPGEQFSINTHKHRFEYSRKRIVCLKPSLYLDELTIHRQRGNKTLLTFFQNRSPFLQCDRHLLLFLKITNINSALSMCYILLLFIVQLLDWLKLAGKCYRGLFWLWCLSIQSDQGVKQKKILKMNPG